MPNLHQTTREVKGNLLIQIASKVELFVANLPTSGDASEAAWRKLGSMTFDSNERSSFKARELKSVHVEAGAQLLRVVLHKPHINSLNTHGQVTPPPDNYS
jgi:centrosomal protein CEP104